jgi:LTXXQ motif family protein
MKRREFITLLGGAAPAVANAAATGAGEAREQRRERYSSRRHRWRAYAAARETPAQGALRPSAAPGWSGACEELGAVLRNWPVREIERDVRLSGGQRVALYELVTTSLKAAETLSSACPVETALTPPARMALMRARLAAVRQATV